MSKAYLCLLFLIISFTALSQNSITIKGKVLEATSKLPLESATIYLTTVKDSAIIDYTIADKSGNFVLKTKKVKQAVFLKVSFIGFRDYQQQIDDLSTDKDFGALYIKENTNLLGEVVVKSEAPPVRIKQDTLEFNASSFKVRPDANVEALLKQLPGVEIDAKGKITVNGKEVNNILVNGKPFFGKDGKVATENLPSDIIDKVQISDTKTKEEELAGQAASSENKTINLTIQEDKNKGLFGKFSGGLGSDNRYESSGLINYFKNEQKLSFLGSSNNINSVGFSMDEIFDSMGGGRNVYTSSDGSFNIDGQQFGGGNGITQSSMIGLNYSDEILKKMEPSGSYFYNSSETKNDNITRSEFLLPEGTVAVGDEKRNIASQNTTRKISNGHNLNFEYEYKIDSLTTLNISPNIKKSNSRYTSTRSQSTKNVSDELLNDSRGYNNNTTDNVAFENNIYFYKKLNKKGRSFNFRFSNENNKDASDLLTISQTNTYKDAPTTEVRNQIETTKDVNDRYEGSLSYNEPISDSLSVGFGGRYKSNKKIYDRNMIDFDPASLTYSQQNDLLSNYIYSRTNTIAPYASLRINKKKIRAGINVGAQFTKFDNFSEYIGDRTTANKDYVFPSLDGYLSYTIGKSKSIYMNYRYEVTLPNANQLLDKNFADPLNTYFGNPDLKPQTSHSFYTGFNNYDWATKSGFYFYSGGALQNNLVVSSTVYDASFKSETTFKNISTTYNTYFGFDYSKSYKIEKNTFKYSLGLESNINLSKGLTNNALYKSQGYNFTPRVELSYEYGELFTASPSYSYNYNYNDFSNYTVDKNNNFVHVLKLEMTSRWPKNVVIGNDFAYTYNSNIADGFQKDFYLWNASLGYNFLNEKLLAKVKVYDILNQNTNSTRTINSTGFSDQQNTVLNRYVMFSLTYKIEKFGGKKKSEWEY